MLRFSAVTPSAEATKTKTRRLPAVSVSPTYQSGEARLPGSFSHGRLHGCVVVIWSAATAVDRGFRATLGLKRRHALIHRIARTRLRQSRTRFSLCTTLVFSSVVLVVLLDHAGRGRVLCAAQTPLRKHPGTNIQKNKTSKMG